jgi:hypothetical protein
MAVNLSPVGGVAAQFFNNSGSAVLTGGKLYTYAAGTTTPAATYTTSQGNVPWTNPVVLDAAGRVPGSGEIWLTDGIIYKFVLKDSNDVLIATYDNITGINSNSVSYTNQQEIVTATAGQTVFNLGISYQPATNSLSVFVDGVNQYGPGAQYSYVETDANTVTFNSGLHVGAEVKFTTTQQQGAGAVDAAQVSYDPPFTGSVATNVEAKLAQIVSVVDFGAVGDGVTDDTAAIQAAIDTGNAIYFPRPSAYYNIGSDVTIDVPFEAGMYRIFGGPGNVTINSGVCEFVIPQWWGASPNASAALNTEAINKSLACFKVTSSVYVYDASWKLPSGSYNINDQLQFPKAGISEAQRCNLVFEGTITQTDNTKNGIRFCTGSGSGIYYTSIKGIRLYGDAAAQQYAQAKHGIQFDGTTANCEIDIPFLYGGFKYGITFSPNNLGIHQFNKISLGVVRGPQYGLNIRTNNVNTNYFNANAIYGGDYACPFLTAANGAGFTVYGIYIQGANASNAWYSPAFAALNYDIEWHGSVGFTMVAPYYDTPVPNETAAYLDACFQGTWIHGYSNFDDLKFVFSSDTRAISFLNTGAYSPASPSAEFYSGISINTPVSSPITNNVIKSTLGSIPTQAKQYIANDWLAMYSYLNKGYEGTASTPSSGTYDVGAIVWNTNTITSGQPAGYMCKTAGTAGTLAGVTGSITINTSVVTVNNASNIAYGQFISVAGALTGAVVLGVNGNQVTVSGTASATVAGVAVSYYAPTWQALANFA